MNKKPLTSNQKAKIWPRNRKILISSLVSVLGFLVSLDIGAQNMGTIKLPNPKLKSNVSLEEAISRRRSVRNYSSKELTVGQIGQLLWACQGITDKSGLRRAAPSAGALYPLEIYLVKKDGVYHYDPDRHTLENKSNKNVKMDLAKASWEQRFIGSAPVNIVICAVYERITSRYGNRGIRYADMEAGHAAENIHLQAVALGLSSVPVGAFDDNAVSGILNLPKSEKPIYIIPVGYKAKD